MNISQTYNSKTQKRLTCLLLCTHVASLTHIFHKLELHTTSKGTSRAEPLCAEPLCAEPLCAEPLCAEPL
jgi:hypothetical protein